ncbi:MAG: hypothetical protein H5T78_03140 [Nocardia sp.]|nr:hypothetical protein [Nocardia sp.]
MADGVEVVNQTASDLRGLSTSVASPTDVLAYAANGFTAISLASAMMAARGAPTDRSDDLRLLGWIAEKGTQAVGFGVGTEASDAAFDHRFEDVPDDLADSVGGTELATIQAAAEDVGEALYDVVDEVAENPASDERVAATADFCRMLVGTAMMLLSDDPAERRETREFCEELGDDVAALINHRIRFPDL